MHVQVVKYSYVSIRRTNFEVPSFTNCKYMIGEAKFKKKVT